jgi:hypothetical protein
MRSEYEGAGCESHLHSCSHNKSLTYILVAECHGEGYESYVYSWAEYDCAGYELICILVAEYDGACCESHLYSCG